MIDPLAVRPPCSVMLAKPLGSTVPAGDYLYEPKWDGFHCVVFRGADSVVLQSRSEEDIAYAFPEVVAAAQALAPGTVLDGELAVLNHGRVDFGMLQQRLRPRSEAGGNIDRLAAEWPASFIAFDLIGLPGRDVRPLPVHERRELLSSVSLPADFHLTPATTDTALARRWFAEVIGAGLDGLIAKPLNGIYQPGVRALGKVKPLHTADVVVAAWRPHKSPGAAGRAEVGSLVLGVYDGQGRLHHVGSASSFSAKARAELTDELAPLALSGGPHPWIDAPAGVRVPDTPNRWKRGADRDLVLLRPERVAEVKFDGMADNRFRHVARLLRWRPDRTPESCGFDQFPQPEPLAVDEVLRW